LNEPTNSRLERIFKQILPVPPGFDVERASKDTLGAWDSIAHINLILAIEQEFRITLTPEEASVALSFEAWSRLVETKLEIAG
jgi:acyl carrier protein